MRLFYELRIIVNSAVSRGILNERAENRIVEFEARVSADLNFNSKRLGTSLDNFDRRRMAIVSDEKILPLRNSGVTKRHRFGGGGGFVEHRCVGNVELGKIDNQCLKIQQRFKPALREFGLVRCVSRVPTGIFENVSLNHRRCNAVRIAGANKRFRDFVFLRDRAQLGERFRFRLRFRQT